MEPRIAVTHSGAQWPNVGLLTKQESGTQFPLGQMLHIDYKYQDFDSATDALFYLDVDQNPYNNNFAPADPTFAGASFDAQDRGYVSRGSTGSSVSSVAGAELHTGGNLALNTNYYVCVKIQDGANQRFAYLPTPIVFTQPAPTPPIATLSDPTSGSTIGQSAINGRKYIDVTFSDTGSSGLDASSILDPGAEFSLSGAAAAGVSISGSPTLVAGTASTYRYTFTGSFGTGAVTVNFAGGSWANLAGNVNLAGTRSFTVTSSQGNTPPTISDIPDQSTPMNTPITIAFTIGDAETPGQLGLNKVSSNTTLVPDTNMSFGGSGANRTITITPALNQTGTSLITVGVSDSAFLTTIDSFRLTVTAGADTQKPEVEIQVPATRPYYTSSSPLTISGVAWDNVGVSAVTWSSDQGGHGNAQGVGAFSAGNIPLVEGTNTITVSASDAAGNVGADQIRVLYTPPGKRPPNDYFQNAIVLSGVSGSANGDNTYATPEPGDPIMPGDIPPARTIWFRWTAPSSGPVDFLFESSFVPLGRARVGIYRGSAISNLSPIWRYDAGAPLRTTFGAVEGTTYHICVDGEPVGDDVSKGAIVITWSLLQAPDAPSGPQPSDGARAERRSHIPAGLEWFGRLVGRVFRRSVCRDGNRQPVDGRSRFDPRSTCVGRHRPKRRGLNRWSYMGLSPVRFARTDKRAGERYVGRQDRG